MHDSWIQAVCRCPSYCASDTVLLRKQVVLVTWLPPWRLCPLAQSGPRALPGSADIWCPEQRQTGSKLGCEICKHRWFYQYPSKAGKFGESWHLHGPTHWWTFASCPWNCPFLSCSSPLLLAVSITNSSMRTRMVPPWKWMLRKSRWRSDWMDAIIASEWLHIRFSITASKLDRTKTMWQRPGAAQQRSTHLWLPHIKQFLVNSKS